MANIGTLYDFTDGSVLYAQNLDDNFSAIRTVVNNEVVHTNKASQTITKTLTFTPDSGAAFDVTTGGITVTAGGITITAGGQTITAGNLTLTAGNLVFGAASAKILPGATSLLIRDTADANTNVTIADSGAVTVRTSLAVTTGNITATAGNVAITAGNLTFGAASAKVIPGATSLLFRNNADSATNVTITDAGAVTLNRSTLSVAAGAVIGGNSGVGTITCTGAGILLSATTNGQVEAGKSDTTTGTDGFFVIGSCAGAPTGVPSAISMSNGIALRYDRTNNKLYAYNGAWKSVTLA